MLNSRIHISRLILPVILFALLFAPLFVFAQPGFDGSIAPECTGQMCGYCDLVTLAENVISFLVFLAISVAILMIVYAGLLYVTAMSNVEQVSKAHRVFRAAIIGLIITLASWLIIEVIVTVLGVQQQIGDPWNLPNCP